MSRSWLFALYRGKQFFYQAFNGANWSGELPVHFTAGISDSPAAAVFYGPNNDATMYVFFQRNHTFFYRSYDGEVWSPELQVPNTAGVNAGIAAAQGQGGFTYLFFSHPGSNSLVYRTFDGQNFSQSDKPVPASFSIYGTPAAAVLNNKIHVFCRGPGQAEPNNQYRFWYATFNGQWQSAIVPNTAGISNGPGAAAYNGKIYVFFNQPNGSFYFKTFSGSTWSADTKLPNTPGCVGNPAAVTFGELFVVYRGPSGRLFYNNSLDGINWKHAQVPATGVTASPAAATLTHW